MIVQKQTFELPSFTTLGGAVIRQVRVGWESYGTLNQAKDNAVLVPHFFSANSHAAGRYQPGDAEPGYWDAIIGPGKPLDTDRYFILSSDTLVNLNAKAEHDHDGSGEHRSRYGQALWPELPHRDHPRLR